MTFTCIWHSPSYDIHLHMTFTLHITFTLHMTFTLHITFTLHMRVALCGIHLRKTFTFVRHSPSYDIHHSYNIHLNVTLIFIIMTFTFIWHWPSFDPFFHMTMNLTYHCMMFIIITMTLLYYRWNEVECTHTELTHFDCWLTKYLDIACKYNVYKTQWYPWCHVSYDNLCFVLINFCHLFLHHCHHCFCTLFCYRNFTVVL